MNIGKIRKEQARMRQRRKRGSSIPVRGIIGVLLLCFVSAVLLNHTSAAGDGDVICVTLRADDITIDQGEMVPELTAKAVCSGDVTMELSEKTGYTIRDLLDELNRGEGYMLSCDGDGSVEGRFEIHVELKGEITTPLLSEWFGKIKINTEKGYLTVKNPYGEWEGDRFKFRDGTYAADSFITYRGKSYYFDSDGKKTVGWQEVNGSRYYFSKKGVMKTGWMEQDKKKYYFADNGVMSIGWKKIDDEKYYFGKDGVMLTGEQRIGRRECVFAKDGKLKSMEGGVDPEKPMIALTFDDGPGPRTEELLEVLKKNNARATFFMLGMNAANYQDTIKKMKEAECELGNHSYDHPLFTTLDEEGIRKQIGDTNSMISEAAGQAATVLRPPYGVVNDQVKANAGMPMILWTMDTLDWKDRDARTIVDKVLASAQDGAIILLHDIYGTTIDAVTELVPELIERGYQIVTVSEMAEARGINLENGGVYSNFQK